MFNGLCGYSCLLKKCSEHRFALGGFGIVSSRFSDDVKLHICIHRFYQFPHQTCVVSLMQLGRPHYFHIKVYSPIQLKGEQLHRVEGVFLVFFNDQLQYWSYYVLYMFLVRTPLFASHSVSIKHH